MASLLTDPHSRPTVVVERSGGGAPYWLVVLLAALLGAVLVGAGMWLLMGASGASSSVTEVRPTNDVLIAIKDIARLEVTEVEVEKVVDISDKQTLFGYIETKDTMLLVAAGTATVGVDLEKMKEGDASYDEATRTARLKLPQPEMFIATLHPDNTYVYRRETGVFAKRNEQLEGKARKEALAAVERAAREPEVIERARKQAERQLTQLLKGAGAHNVVITWQK
jgi:hypothetical protein